MKTFTSNYFKKTPNNYMVFEALTTFIFTVVAGYTFFIFGPMLLNSKNRSNSNSNVRQEIWTYIIENQLFIITSLLFIGLILSVLSIRNKKKLHIVKVVIDSENITVFSRKLYGKQIHECTLPLSNLKINRKSYKKGFYFGNIDAYDLYEKDRLIGHLFLDHFFWSEQQLVLRQLKNHLAPYVVSGKFTKPKEIDFFR